LLAVATFDELPVSVAVYDVSGTPTLVSSTHDPSGGGGTGAIRDMTFDPSGNHLLLATAAPYSVYSLTTNNLLPSAQYPTGPYPHSLAVTADGNYVAGGISTNSGPDTFVYPVAGTTPVRTWQVGNDDLPNIAHALAFSPDSSLLFAIAEDGTTGHLAFHVLASPTVPLTATTTSLTRVTPSKASVRYGSQASLKVQVNGATSGTVDLYATPAGGTKQLITTGTLSAGTKTFSVKPTQNTTYSAELEQGSTWASSTSQDVTVDVAPNLSVSARAHGTGRVQGRRVRKILFTTGINPARPNEPVVLVVQHNVNRHWRTDVTKAFQFAPDGSLHVIFYTNKHGLFRLRASYSGDTYYVSSQSAWTTFRVKRLG
jgi:hypothetical protein